MSDSTFFVRVFVCYLGTKIVYYRVISMYYRVFLIVFNIYAHYE